MSRRIRTGWTLRLAALGAVGVLSAGLTGIAHAAYSGGNGRIAFVRGGEIYTIQPGGTGLLRLTGSGHSSGPRWSPGGSRIAFVHNGDLWVMNADGSHAAQLTHGAPAFTVARPTWSPNGRYLAFVRTARGATSGFLTRYDTTARTFRTFVTTAESGSLRAAALPAAVAWQETAEGQSALLFEGTGRLCPAQFRFCLAALTFSGQSDYQGGDPSLEWAHANSTRFRDPDWYPNRPPFATGVVVSVERCPAGAPCTHAGIETSLNFPARPLALPGGYQAVRAPNGARIAYVRNVGKTPTIFTTTAVAQPAQGTRLVPGTEPDWQPLP